MWKEPRTCLAPTSPQLPGKGKNCGSATAKTPLLNMRNAVDFFQLLCLHSMSHGVRGIVHLKLKPFSHIFFFKSCTAFLLPQNTKGTDLSLCFFMLVMFSSYKKYHKSDPYKLRTIELSQGRRILIFIWRKTSLWRIDFHLLIKV